MSFSLPYQWTTPSPVSSSLSIPGPSTASGPSHDSIANQYDYTFTTGTNLSVTQTAGTGPEIIDLRYSTYQSVTANVTDAADVILTDGSTITNFTVNVNVDGYKVPYAATTVNYGATQQAIAAPYNTAQPLPYFIAGLLFDPAPHWTNTIGAHATAPTLHFSFMQSAPSYATSSDANGFASLGPDLPAGYTPQQLLDANANHTVTLSTAEVSALQALANWAAVVNINFVSAADSNAVEMRFGSNTQTNSGAYSYTPVMPSAPYFTSNSYLEQADIYLNKQYNTSNYIGSGGYDGQAFAHEIGHAIGQGGESGNGDPHDTIAYNEDTTAYTVESYNFQPGPYPNGPQVFDVATSQYLYGPNANYHPNPSHLWAFSAAGGVGNLVSDGGGSVNTISAAGATQNATIDLRPGHWSYLGSQSPDVLAPNQLFIDYGTTVTNVVGGNGNDTIICNDTGDSVTTGNGNNLIVVAGGNDTITGGTGHNTVLFADPAANYAITAGGGSVTVNETVTPSRGTVQGTNTLSNVQYLQFSDRTVFVENSDASNIARLYSAAFNRTPDTGGLSYWIDQYAALPAATKAQGTSALLGISASFMGSAEFQHDYGNPTDSQFVNLLYQNVLARAPDTGGLNFWLSDLANGDSRQDVLIQFAESAENAAKANYQQNHSTGWLITV